MKKMTSILLGLSLSTVSAFAGQIHMTADAAGNEYSSMVQDRSGIKTIEVADQDTLEIYARATKIVNISLGGMLAQVKFLQNGKIYLTNDSKQDVNVEFTQDILGQPSMLVAQTDLYTIVIAHADGFKKVGGLNGILDHMIGLGVGVAPKFLSYKPTAKDDFAFVLIGRKTSHVVAVQQMNMSIRLK